MTADINNTVIKGTPLYNSINPIDVYLIAGSVDLLPNAKIVPIGKQSIKANADTINVNAVSYTHLTLPTICSV